MTEWRISDAPVEYPDAIAWMEARVDAIRAGHAPECVWLLEHPPLYTAGTSARPEELVDPRRLPVYSARRGGRYTYHGPGQRVAYVMLDLEARGRDLRRFVHALEGWVIAALADFQVRGERRAGRVGVWVSRSDKAPRPSAIPGGPPAEDKIAAIGVRVRRWVTFHGVSINVDPNLDHYRGIVPCGISGHGVTSLVDLGLPVGIADLDLSLRRRWAEFFPAPDDLPGQRTDGHSGAPARIEMAE